MSGIYTYQARTPSPRPAEYPTRNHHRYRAASISRQSSQRAPDDQSWPYPTQKSEPSGKPAPSKQNPTVRFHPDALVNSNPEIDPLLCPRPGEMVVYDMRELPVHARKWDASNRKSSLTTHDLLKPACTPGRTIMRIVIPELPDWPVKIRSEMAYITVGDILEALYSTLHQKVSLRRCENLRGREQEQVLQAYDRRCLKLSLSPEMGYIRRSDWLGENTHFKGLSRRAKPNGEGETWTLFVGPQGY